MNQQNWPFFAIFRDWGIWFDTPAQMPNFFAQNEVKTKKKGHHFLRWPISCPKWSEDQKKKKNEKKKKVITFPDDQFLAQN